MNNYFCVMKSFKIIKYNLFIKIVVTPTITRGRFTRLAVSLYNLIDVQANLLLKLEYLMYEWKVVSCIGNSN